MNRRTSALGKSSRISALIGAASPREAYKRSVMGRNAPHDTMKKHGPSSDGRHIQYRGTYSRHSRGRTLTNNADQSSAKSKYRCRNV
jgi:hypothetical protein